MTMLPAVTWFQIPVADLDRASRFHETVLAIPLGRGACPVSGQPMAGFKLCAQNPEARSGCLINDNGAASTAEGITVSSR